MSITNTIQLVDSQEKSLHAEKSVDVIKKLIQQKRIAEANRLFQESAPDMEKDDREKISKQLSTLVEQAEEYFCEADTLETERKLEHAREKYKKVEKIAIDYPELPEALKRIDESIALIRALEHRAKRRTSRQDKQSALLTTSSQSERHGGWFPLLTCFSLLLIMVGAGLSYTENLDLIFNFTEKDTVLQVAPLEKEETGKQHDSRKQDEQITIEKTMGEKSTPQLQDHAANRLTVGDFEQTQHTRPVIKQQDESPVEISSSRKNSAESVYIVQPGDILGLISLKVYGTSSNWSAIANANEDQLANNPDELRVGMALAIPTFSETGNVPLPLSSSTSMPVLNEDGTYTVQSGDSLGIISEKLFGNAWKWRKIYELNIDVLTAPHKLKVGQILRVKAFGASGPLKETIESSEPEPEEEHPTVVYSLFGAGPSDYINSQ